MNIPIKSVIVPIATIIFLRFGLHFVQLGVLLCTFPQTLADVGSAKSADEIRCCRILLWLKQRK